MIEKFAFYSAPLSDLLKKNAKWNWTDECQRNFEHLRQCLHTVPILRHPDFSKIFEVHSDACKDSIAGVLMQTDQDDIPHPVAFFSRKLRLEERKYSVTELEALAIIASIKNFHYYIYGREFVVVTDHQPLKTVFETKSKNARVQRWALFLQDYTFSCRYKCGKEHYLPDALSRNVASLVCKIIANNKQGKRPTYKGTLIKKLALNFDPMQVFSAENVAKEQIAEERWYNLITFLKGGRVPSPPPNTYLDEFAIFDNCLFYKQGKYTDNYRLVIPKTLVEYALFMSHDSKTCAHHGFVKTIHFARKAFYWPNMVSDIKQYCKCCEVCQKRKPGKKPFAPLGRFEAVHSILQRVGVDLIGPMEETKLGNKYILTVVDYFSRYTQVFALPCKESFTVSEAFSQFIVTHGQIETIISDRGTEFLSKMFKGLCQQFGIKIKPTNAFNPKCNGLTEARNKQISDILHFLTEDTFEQWDLLLHYVQAALNGSFHPVIDNTPFYLFFACDYVIPYNLIFNRKVSEFDSTDASLRIKLAFENAKRSQEFHTEKIMHYYNKNARPHQFKTGDLVLVQNTTKAGPHMRKLNPRFLGPFRIIDVLTEQVIKIADFSKVNKFYTVNVNRCKRFYSNDISYPIAESVDTELYEDEITHSGSLNNNHSFTHTTNDSVNASASGHGMTLRSHMKQLQSQKPKHVRFGSVIELGMQAPINQISSHLSSDDRQPIGILKH